MALTGKLLHPFFFEHFGLGPQKTKRGKLLEGKPQLGRQPLEFLLGGLDCRIARLTAAGEGRRAR
jgi:hypothetical protein